MASVGVKRLKEGVCGDIIIIPINLNGMCQVTGTIIQCLPVFQAFSNQSSFSLIIDGQIHAFILSHHDNCNLLLYGIPDT